MKFGFGSQEQRESANKAAETITVEANVTGLEYSPHRAVRDGGIKVDEATALSIPAMWAAVNIIAGTIAHMPLHLYKVDKDGNPEKQVKNPLYAVVHDYPNDVHTKFTFWKLIVSRYLISGRGLAILLRDKADRVVGFYPINESGVTITQTFVNGAAKRFYKLADGKTQVEGRNMIDLSYLYKPDGVSVYSPVTSNHEALAAIIAAETYATSMFANGGVPPMKLKVPNGSSGKANDRAQEQFETALKISRYNNNQVIPVPELFDLEAIGFEPAKQQLVELRKWQISEVARIMNIAPALLHDLTGGTFNNVEHQALSFSQNTILPIVKMIEQELNLKLFGKRNNSNYVEFNMDALIRGDFLSRMDGMTKAVSGGIRTPNEVRALDNLPPLENGDKLYVQGAVVPLGSNLVTPDASPAPEPNDDPVEPSDDK